MHAIICTYTRTRIYCTRIINVYIRCAQHLLSVFIFFLLLLLLLCFQFIYSQSGDDMQLLRSNIFPLYTHYIVILSVRMYLCMHACICRCIITCINREREKLRLKCIQLEKSNSFLTSKLIDSLVLFSVQCSEQHMCHGVVDETHTKKV